MYNTIHPTNCSKFVLKYIPILWIIRFYIKIATLLNAIENAVGDLSPSCLVERSQDNTLHQRTYLWCILHTDDQINGSQNLETTALTTASNSNIVNTNENDDNNTKSPDDNKFYLFEDNQSKSGGFVNSFCPNVLKVTMELVIDLVCLIIVVMTFVSPIRLFELISCLLMSPKWLSVWSSRQCLRKVLVMDQLIQEFKVDLAKIISTNLKKDAQHSTNTCKLFIDNPTLQHLHNKYLRSFKSALVEARKVGNKFGEGCDKLFGTLLPTRVQQYEHLMFHYCIMMSAKQWTITNECMEDENFRERVSIVVQVMNERLLNDANKLEGNLADIKRSIDETVKVAEEENKWKIGILKNPLHTTRDLVGHQMLSALKDVLALLMLIFILITFVRVIPLFKEMYQKVRHDGRWSFDHAYLVLRKHLIGTAVDIMNIGKFSFYSFIGDVIFFLIRFL